MPAKPTPLLFPSQGDTGSQTPLPPENGSQLVGIARLASSSPRADAKRGVEYFLLPAKSIVNRCESERVSFPWSVNPYRGCEFACRYCYARYTHEYMELTGEDFERKIFVKGDTGPLAARDLLTRGKSGEHIAIGTATDPYQPAERQFGATRAVLEQMARLEGLSVSITTKSNLVLRDLDLLLRIAERSSISVNITVTTLRARLARLLEPRAPRPDLRLAALRSLRDAGLPAGVNLIPILPGLTDEEKDLDALARAAREAGANWLAAGVLFLMPPSRTQFMPFLEKKFPKLASRYRQWYSHAAYAPEQYQREISERVATLRKKYGLISRPSEPRPRRASSQLALDLFASAS
jgi:DNA repair photolyase